MRPVPPSPTLLIFLLLAALPACTTPQPHTTPAAQPSAGADHFVGFYRMPDRNWRTGTESPGPGTLIVVLKHGEDYFTVCRGAEAPLKPCPAGLEWAVEPSSLKGTTIGYDAETREYYIRIFDSQGDQFIPDTSEFDAFKPGFRRTLYRVDPPPLCDPTAPPPQSLDDFVGDYVLLWQPQFTYNIRKENGQFMVRGNMAGLEGEEQKPLTPLADGLGFQGPESDTQFVYNAALRRFELVFEPEKSRTGVVRMPFVRFPFERIGIPCWH